MYLEKSLVIHAARCIIQSSTTQRREKMTYPISRAAINERIALWDKSSAIHFCLLAQKGATFENVVYPTGLKMVKAILGNSTAEVKLNIAKQLRSDGWKIRA